jgi:hypothetical protein
MRSSVAAVGGRFPAAARIRSHLGPQAPQRRAPGLGRLPGIRPGQPPKLRGPQAIDRLDQRLDTGFWRAS